MANKGIWLSIMSLHALQSDRCCVPIASKTAFFSTVDGMNCQGVQSNDWRCRHWCYTDAWYAVACVVLRTHGCSTKSTSAPTYCTVWRVQRVHRAGLLSQPRCQATCFDHVTVDPQPLASQTDLKPFSRHMDTHRGRDQITCIVADVLECQRPIEQRGEIGRVPKLCQSYTKLYLPHSQLDI